MKLSANLNLKKGRRQSHLYANFIVKPAVKSSGSLNPAIDKKDIPTDDLHDVNL